MVSEYLRWRVMPPEERRPHMSAWCEETPSVHGSGGPVDTKLHRIAEKARKEPQFKFTSLYHLMNEELLRECFKWLRKDAAAGLEDKLVQAGLVRILEAVYEQDFIEDSYGFRSKRSCHQALRVLGETVENGPVNHIVEADIKGFFDNVKQAWLMKFLEHRIGDKRIQRMVKRFLKAGGSEDGSITGSDEGPPQGGGITPLLANIYLHYALDLWVEKV